MSDPNSLLVSSLFDPRVNRMYGNPADLTDALQFLWMSSILPKLKWLKVLSHALAGAILSEIRESFSPVWA